MAVMVKIHDGKEQMKKEKRGSRIWLIQNQGSGKRFKELRVHDLYAGPNDLIPRRSWAQDYYYGVNENKMRQLLLTFIFINKIIKWMKLWTNKIKKIFH